jgi:hypothetical protein
VSGLGRICRLDATDGKQALIADTLPSLRRSLLLKDSRLRDEIAENGYALVRARYRWDVRSNSIAGMPAVEGKGSSRSEPQRTRRAHPSAEAAVRVSERGSPSSGPHTARPRLSDSTGPVALGRRITSRVEAFLIPHRFSFEAAV